MKFRSWKPTLPSMLKNSTYNRMMDHINDKVLMRKGESKLNRVIFWIDLSKLTFWVLLKEVLNVLIFIEIALSRVQWKVLGIPFGLFIRNMKKGDVERTNYSSIPSNHRSHLGAQTESNCEALDWRERSPQSLTWGKRWFCFTPPLKTKRCKERKNPKWS